MRIPSILAGAFALAATLSAQTALPPVTPTPISPIAPVSPPLAELKQYLNLTDAQVTSLNNIVQQKSDALQQINEQISQKNQTLQTLLASASPNPTTVGQTMIDIQNLEKQLVPSTEPYHSEALAVLTSSQTPLLANLNTALLLQPAVSEACSVNLLVSPAPAPVTGTTAVLVPASCPPLVYSVPVPLPVPGGTTLPGVLVPAMPPPGQ